MHSRKAELHCIDILEESGYKKVVLHCFNGRKHVIKRAAALGYYFSIPTSVVKSKTLKKLAKRVPIDRILTETDAPYLCPSDGRNDSSFIRESIVKIASVKEVSVKEMEEQVWKNYAKIFR